MYIELSHFVHVQCICPWLHVCFIYWYYMYTVPLVSLSSSSPFLFFLIAQSQRNYSAAFEKIRSLFNSAPPVPVKLLILITTSSDYNFDGARISTSSNTNFQIKSYTMHGNNDNNYLHVILVHAKILRIFINVKYKCTCMKSGWLSL